MVEKDNKRLRDEVRKEYNNTVRELAIFIQNRDPRYHAYQRQRERSKKEAARSTAGMGPRGSGKSTPNNARVKPTATQSVHARMAHQREVDSFTLQSWQKAENNIDWDEDETIPLMLHSDSRRLFERLSSKYRVAKVNNLWESSLSSYSSDLVSL